ncbi:MAG: hypothetical protein CL943_03615 [Candidatus Diapherotrites archaeon]|uniref:Uncharacterized protein n=1 Tax=Candidatus Iainarchaeum sp. TaxID=3101447 RepID=A0A2D6M1Q4_9ARCH|nr:hypothetical protein [Candidatus Diapherotrites archaeon]
MDFKHIASATKSTLLVLAAFALVLFIRLVWMDWSGQFTLPFLRTGRIGELIFLFAIGSVIAIVFTKLLQMQFHAETRSRRRRIRRRR